MIKMWNPQGYQKHVMDSDATHRTLVYINTDDNSYMVCQANLRTTMSLFQIQQVILSDPDYIVTQPDRPLANILQVNIFHNDMVITREMIARIVTASKQISCLADF